MIRHKDINQPSLFDFSGKNERGGYDNITHDTSILTARIKQPKLSNGTEKMEILSLQAMKYCSRFESCSAPKCPLDILIKARSEVDGDPKCEMARATRHKHWEAMPENLRNELPFQGYFEVELKRMNAARERWESLPDDQKVIIKERLRNLREGRSQ
ncbi:hypothetical protein [Cuniculiplasma divulgatum]|uniref:Uncharacterized protein n=1 Tax=Cuniculiplasma divulgatum TaxID=1673428 RepID=A0A1N5TN19_9ARCH|nr:hypothetical protein [Cuniculiplasma divulgatum]SIM49455.1 hypothetical protein CSP5_0620 [Cuniculiplasma divulgatum]